MRTRLLSSFAALFALPCLLHVATAKAETFLFTATGANLNASATLTGVADPTVAGAYDLTGGSGTLNGTSMSLYLPSGTATTSQVANFGGAPFQYHTTYYYDNVVYLTGNDGVAIDVYGLLFSLPTDHFNPFAAGKGYVYSDDEIINGFNSPLTSLTITDLGPSGPTSVTPEPSSFALMGTALLGTVGMVRRRSFRA